MRKMYTSVVGVMIAMTLLGSGAAAQMPIYNVIELQAMQGNLAGDYVLANDIDASDTRTWNSWRGFAPVGTYGDEFTGTFDGAGHTITGLIINRRLEDYVGLFGSASGATIENVVLVDADVLGCYSVGALAGEVHFSDVTNCHAIAVVESDGYDYVGGLIGAVMDSTIAKCHTAGDVSGYYCLGGLVGSEGDGTTISDCYSTASVSGLGTHVGGLIGEVWTNILPVRVTRCYSTGPVSGAGNVGGLIGYADSPSTFFTRTYWDVQTSGQMTSARQAPGQSEGMTTGQMMQQSTFVTWDFSAIWDIVEFQTYPHFQPSPGLPVGVTVERAIDQDDPVDTLPIRFDVVFNESVTGFDANDLSIGGTADGVTATLTGSGATYTVWIIEVTTPGTVQVSIPAGRCQAVDDGGLNSASTSDDNTVNYIIPEQVPLAWGTVAIAMLAAGVATIRRKTRTKKSLDT